MIDMKLFLSISKERKDWEDECGHFCVTGGPIIKLSNKNKVSINVSGLLLFDSIKFN